MKVMELITIETPRGSATIDQKCVWVSENKDFEKTLNNEFGKTSDITTHEQRQYGVAIFVLADHAVRKYGGKITRIKEKTIRKTRSKDALD